MTPSPRALTIALVAAAASAGCGRGGDARARGAGTDERDTRPTVPPATDAATATLPVLQALQQTGAIDEAAIRRALAAASPEERRALEPVLPALLAVAAIPDSDERNRAAIATAGVFGAALERLAALHAGEVDVQLQINATIEMLGWQVDNLGGDGAVHRRRALAMAEALAVRFPDEPRVHLRLAEARFRSGHDHLGALGALVRCVELAPSDPRCRELHAEIARAHARPWCGPDAIAADLRVTIGSGTLTSAELSEAIAGIDQTAIATLTPAGAAHLAELTAAAAAAQPAAVEISRGDTVLVRLTVEHRLEGPAIGLGGLSLDQVCTRVVVRQLPAELRLPP